MSEVGTGTGASAGALLRQAREQRGLGIAALAAAIKVAPRKLEALEADRFEDLPDVAFGRALALTICRALKIDAAPVLAALPRLPGHRLEQVAQGLNTPYLERPGRRPLQEGHGLDWSPMRWASVLVLLAAAVVYFLPVGWSVFPPTATRVAARPAASAVDVASAVDGALFPPAGTEAAALAASALAGTVYTAPLESVALPASGVAAAAASVADPVASGAAAPSAALQFRARAETWVEVSDAAGQPLLSRTLAAGESVGVDGALPLRVRIGNAAATDVVFRGEPFAIAPHSRENIAKFELK